MKNTKKLIGINEKTHERLLEFQRKLNEESCVHYSIGDCIAVLLETADYKNGKKQLVK